MAMLVTSILETKQVILPRRVLTVYPLQTRATSNLSVGHRCTVRGDSDTTDRKASIASILIPPIRYDGEAPGMLMALGRLNKDDHPELAAQGDTAMELHLLLTLKTSPDLVRHQQPLALS